MNLDCRDKSLLIAYLYGECDAAEREAFERHLATCTACATEVRALGKVRGELKEWTPPEVSLGFRVVRDEAPQSVVPFTPRAPATRRWATLPAWAGAAAAVLVLAAGAAIANLDVRVGNGGVTLRTGWQQPAATSGAKDAAPWRAELAALERNLRRDMSPTPAAARAGAPVAPMNASAPLGGTAAQASRGLSAADTAELARRFDSLIAQSEHRQQQAFENMLATRLVQFGRDVDVQRRADLVRIQQGLGQMDTRTTSELAQLREMQKYLYRVANIQEIK